MEPYLKFVILKISYSGENGVVNLTAEKGQFSRHPVKKSSLLKMVMRTVNKLIDHGLPVVELPYVVPLPKLVDYVVAKRLLLIFILFSLFWASSSEAAPAVAWNFDHPGEMQDWEWKGIEAAQVPEGIFHILGKEEFQLMLPPGLNISAEENTHLKIRLRTLSPRYLRIFWQPADFKEKLPSLILQPHPDLSFNTYWINLGKSPAWQGRIDRVGMIFRGIPGVVEIDSLEIGPFSIREFLACRWKEFWQPRNLNLATINSLNSPRLFSKPFISWLNKLAVIVLILGAFFYLKAERTRRVKIALRTGLVLLIIWMIYDIRETCNQFKMVEEIYQSYIKPPPEIKTLPYLGNFYSFIELCRKQIPPDSQFHFYSDPNWPYDCRTHYFLYPRRMNSNTWVNIIEGKEIPYHVVYNNSHIHYDPSHRRLRYTGPEGEFFISPPGRVLAPFDQNSFVFLEDR